MSALPHKLLPSVNNMAFKLLFIFFCLYSTAHCNPFRSALSDERLVKVEVGGEVYNLNLKRSLRQVVKDHVPIYSLKRIQEGDFVKPLEYSQKNRRINGAIYNDDQNMATMLVRENKYLGRVLYEGVISPGSVAQRVKFSRALKKNLQPRTSYSPPSVFDSTPLQKPLPALYPKIVVGVDYSLYKKLGEDINKVFKYVTIFFNAVDLRFSKLTSIKVQISVTGLVIDTDEKINLGQAKNFFAQKFIEKTGFRNFDVVFLMTTTGVRALTGRIQRGSICNKSYNTIFEQDDGAYSALLHTIHDLAHLLNVGHDGEGDSEQCDADDTIMAETKLKRKAIHWSQCSNNIIKEFAKTVGAVCLMRGYYYPNTQGALESR